MSHTKKLILWTVVVLLLQAAVSVFLISTTHLRGLTGPVTIHFEHRDTGEQTSVTLTDEESAQILEILEGERAMPEFGTPSCGFSWDTAIEIEGVRYGLALDTCPVLIDFRDFRTNWYIGITRDEQQVIEEIFLRYGARYPNV